MMTNTPFWKQTLSEGNTEPEAPAAEMPTTPGKPSAIDPNTSAWRPIKRGEPFTVGEHEFAWSEGPIATVTLHDGDGNELGTMHVPFDPDTQESDDNMLEEASLPRGRNL